MKIYDTAATRKALSFYALIDAIEAMFIEGCEAPLRLVHEIEVRDEVPSTVLIMPAWQQGKFLGIKTVNIFAVNAKRACLDSSRPMCGAAVAPPCVVRNPKSGAYSGFFSDLCRDFGQNVLRVKVEFVDTTWENIVAGLQSEKWDLSMALNDTPEREKAIAFSGPATDYNVSFVHNKNNPRIPKSLHSATDFNKPGTVVAVMSGTSADKAISAVLKQAQVMRLPGNDETRLALISKRADLLADANITNTLFDRSLPGMGRQF